MVVIGSLQTRGIAAVFLVQLGNSGLGQRQQRRICNERFLRRIAKIGQQGKIQTGIAISQKPDFQRLDQILNACSAGQHGWHHHQRLERRRNAGGKIHARQRFGRHQQCGQPINQRHRQLAARQHSQQRYRQPCPLRHGKHRRQRQKTTREDGRDQPDGAEINQQRVASKLPPQQVIERI